MDELYSSIWRAAPTTVVAINLSNLFAPIRLIRQGYHTILSLFSRAFRRKRTLKKVARRSPELTFEEVHVGDLKFDIGAYAEAVHQIECDRICFLNTTSEPASSHWLLKLALNLEQPGVGLVGGHWILRRRGCWGIFPERAHPDQCFHDAHASCPANPRRL